MAKIRRTIVIILAIGLTVIGTLIFTGVSAKIAILVGGWSYPAYFVLQTVCSFLILGLYNPAKDGFFKRLVDRLTRFNFERLGYIGKPGYICATVMNVFAVAFWNTIYIFGFGGLLKRLFN